MRSTKSLSLRSSRSRQRGYRSGASISGVENQIRNEEHEVRDEHEGERHKRNGEKERDGFARVSGGSNRPHTWPPRRAGEVADRGRDDKDDAEMHGIAAQALNQREEDRRQHDYEHRRVDHEAGDQNE